MTPDRLDPFVIPAEDLAPATLTPSEAPPPPDDEPQGAAMQATTEREIAKR